MKVFCRYCKKEYNDLWKVHFCEDTCRSKRYIHKMEKLFDLDLKSLFGGDIDTNNSLIDKNYNKFMVEVIKKEKEQPRLSTRDLEGVKMYYENVLKNIFEQQRMGIK